MNETTRERVTRKCTAKGYEYMDGGENKRKDVIITYFSPTTTESKRERERLEKILAEDPNAPVWFTDSLVTRLKSIVDAQTGKPEYEISQENLDNDTNFNITLIREAIENDINPKSIPAK